MSSSWSCSSGFSALSAISHGSAGCPPDYYLGHTALTVDASNRVVLLYDGATSAGGPQTITARTSTNQGATWTTVLSQADTVAGPEHTEVGHRTIGAKVNGKLVPLDYELRTGDSVDVLTSKAQGEGPSQDWLQFVATPRARNKIRQWFARGRREDALDQGKDLLQRQMRKQNLSFKRLTTEEALEQVATDLKQPDLDALYVAVGEGHVSPQSVVARLSRQLSGSAEEDVTDVPLARPVRITQPDVAKGVMVKGLGDVWVRLGRCCTPVPGDQIVGFVTRGQGVSVHRADCPNVKTLRREPERMIEVSWAEGKSTSFVVAIQVEALDRTRLLSDIATMLSDQHVNILSANSSTGRDRITRLRFSFELADITHLSSLLASVKRVENVYDAYRVVPS